MLQKRIWVLWNPGENTSICSEMTLECTSTANIVNSATLAKCKYETTIQSPYKNQTCHLHLESCSKSNIHTITENYLPYSHTISLKNNHQKKKTTYQLYLFFVDFQKSWKFIITISKPWLIMSWREGSAVRSICYFSTGIKFASQQSTQVRQ